MKILKYICVALVLYIPMDGYSQSILENIRSEYYRLNSGNVHFETVEISNKEYFLEEGKIRKVVECDSLGVNEYYYNFNNGFYKTFFIYFAPNEKSKLPESRLYLNEGEEVFLYKENELEKSFFDSNSYSNRLILKSRNALNKFSTILLESRDEYEKEMLFVDSLFQLIEQSKLIEIGQNSKTYIEEESQLFDEGKRIFVNSDEAIVKTIELQGDNHGSEKTIEYFHDGKLILRITESQYYINGFQYSVEKEYYTREILEQVMFRKEEYENSGAKLDPTSNNPLNFRLDKIEPRIMIIKKH